MSSTETTGPEHDRAGFLMAQVFRISAQLDVLEPISDDLKKNVALLNRRLDSAKEELNDIEGGQLLLNPEAMSEAES